MLGAPYHADVDLLHVFHPAHFDHGYGLLLEFEQSMAGHEMKKCLADCMLRGDVAAHGRVASGDHHTVPEAILDVASDDRYDLIVMGTRGHLHLLKSGLVERVLRDAPCPVVTVRASELSFA